VVTEIVSVCVELRSIATTDFACPMRLSWLHDAIRSNRIILDESTSFSYSRDPAFPLSQAGQANQLNALLRIGTLLDVTPFKK